MTRFLLVRHGETEWNAEGRVQGGGHLNANGRGQIKALARRLQHMGDIATILASPTERTIETADAFSRTLGLPVERHDGLLDLDYGIWSGTTLAAAQKTDPALFNRWSTAPHTVHFHGGQSLGELRQRILTVVDEGRERFPDKTTLLVTHDSPIRVVVCYALGLTDANHLKVKADVGSLTIVELGQDSSVLVTLNDTCHIRQHNDHP